MTLFTLIFPLGRYSYADEGDIHVLKTALNRLGYYTPDPRIGYDDERNANLFDAIQSFQRGHNLKENSYLMPFDETVRALDAELKSQDLAGRYVWRSVHDVRVRDAHAAREGQIFTWGNPPEGGHPGEDYNCRCWAEVLPVPEKKPIHPPIPSQKPNCDTERENFEKAGDKLERLRVLKENFLAELQKLKEKKDINFQKMKEILGINIATFIIGLPIADLAFIVELLIRYFGQIISNELLEAADALAKEREVIYKEIEYKLDQLRVVLTELEKVAQEFEKAQKALEECQIKIH